VKGRMGPYAGELLAVDLTPEAEAALRAAQKAARS
jgi:hypothetical protein